jgi:hypothetical protein
MKQGRFIIQAPLQEQKCSFDFSEGCSSMRQHLMLADRMVFFAVKVPFQSSVDK